MDGDGLTAFLRMPRLLYDGLEGFVPRLDFAERQALDPKRAPFFRHGIAHYWTAWRDGKPVGRISAQIDRLQTEPYGMFGCLDAVDDPQVVALLLGQAEKWLTERGMTACRGPFTLSINGESGLLTDGQGAPPTTLMGWNPAYLEKHVISTGYNRAKVLLAYGLDLKGVDAAALLQAVKTPKLLPSVSLRTLKLGNLDSECEIIARVYNDAWRRNWGFVPITTDEVTTLAHAFRPMLVPECGIIVELDGEPIAVALILPNLAELTGDFGGKLLPFAWARLLWRMLRKDYRSGRLALFGVAERYRMSILGSAIPLAIIGEYIRYSRKYGLSQLELSWVLEDNAGARSVVEKMGAKITKHYSILEKTISASPVRLPSHE